MQPRQQQLGKKRASLQKQLVSLIPQLIVSTGVLYYQEIVTILNTDPHVHFTVFILSSLSLSTMFLIFVYLQFIRPFFHNAARPDFATWERDPVIVMAIRSATLAGILAFVGFHVALAGVYGWLTPLVVVALFVQVFSAVAILSAVADEFQAGGNTHQS